MSEPLKINRREFVKFSALAAGGLTLGFYLPSAAEAKDARGAVFAPNAFVRVGTDGSVTIIVNHSEMGQGVYTALPMLVAEELECDWRSVRLEPAPVNPVYNHTMFGNVQMTGGSTSVRSEWDRLSKAGAAARMMLIAAAAREWKVDPSSCRAEDGKVVHNSGKSLTYGKLAARAAKMPVPKEVPLKNPSAYNLLGKPVHRLDDADKVSGKAVFGLDARAPGMLTALIARSPVFGGKVKGFDAGKANAVRGVRKVFRVPTGVAVVADGYYAARKGRDALEVSWDEGEGAKLSTDGMRAEYSKLASAPGFVARKDGDADSVLAASVRQLTAEYEVPYLAHATMEPLNCLVVPGKDSCDIWTGTQFQTGDRNAAAEVLGLKPEKVRIHTTYLGGGFGRRANKHNDFVKEAAEVAKVMKKPVKVVWTREDDMKGGYYRPMWYDRIAAGLERDGKLTAWRHTIVGQSIMADTPFAKSMIREGVDNSSAEGASDIPYAIPNVLVDLHSPVNQVPVLWWRSVGHSHTAFVVESFMDEVAHVSGTDPLELRRTLLAKSPRHKAVLELAAEKAGWGAAPPNGLGRGLAVHDAFGSYVAQVAEVSVSPEGAVRVHRVVCAVDCGRIVNPDIVAAQMESAIVFGLSAALYEAITLKDGRVEQNNFDDFPMLRMSAMPKVEVHIVKSSEAPGGVGEPGVPPVAPAVCNAIFAATGVRIRRLPIRAEELKKAT